MPFGKRCDVPFHQRIVDREFGIEPAKAVAEAFGVGGWARIIDMMSRLEKNLAAGDGVVDVIGFSRGAAILPAIA